MMTRTMEDRRMEDPNMEGSSRPGQFLQGLKESRLVAIVRGTDGPAAALAALAVMEEGFRYVEVALTTPGALAAIRQIRGSAPEGCFVGAGTVLTAQDVRDVVAAGGQFIVTPALAGSIEAGAGLGLPVLAGALTPSEAYEAMTRGATAVKLFPASVGGPAYLKALRDPFPQIPFIAVGGVGLTEAPAFWAVGAVAVGPGGPLIGDAASGGDLAALRERARAFVALAADQAEAKQAEAKLP
jgi:2-dehydro-3-deoxyphosphogluconate aldolase / (4S)-4-hydroxy-2-oxoglutarate aldolase